MFLLQAPTAEAQRLVAHDFECIDVLTEGEAHQRSSILVGLGGVNILRIATSLFPREQGHGVKMDSELFMHAGGEGIRVLADQRHAGARCSGGSAAYADVRDDLGPGDRPLGGGRPGRVCSPAAPTRFGTRVLAGVLTPSLTASWAK